MKRLSEFYFRLSFKQQSLVTMLLGVAGSLLAPLAGLIGRVK